MVRAAFISSGNSVSMSMTEENSLEEIKSLVYLQDKVSMHVACRDTFIVQYKQS